MARQLDGSAPRGFEGFLEYSKPRRRTFRQLYAHGYRSVYLYYLLSVPGLARTAILEHLRLYRRLSKLPHDLAGRYKHLSASKSAQYLLEACNFLACVRYSRRPSVRGGAPFSVWSTALFGVNALALISKSKAIWNESRSQREAARCSSSCVC